jgi:hypothetical protein
MKRNEISLRKVYVSREIPVWLLKISLNPWTLFAAIAHLPQDLILRPDAKSYVSHVTQHDVVLRMIQNVTKKYMGDKNYRNLIE